MTGNVSSCPYDFDVVEDLRGKNITAADEMEWPCILRVFWVQIHPFVSFVRGLLSYGTPVIVTLGICLNVLSFVVLTQKHMRKTTTNMYLSTLAIYDTLSLTMNFMIGVLRGNSLDMNKRFQGSEDLCRFHGVTVEMFNLLSVWVIVLFTVERCFTIKYPMKAKIITTKTAFIALLTISLIVVVFSLHKVAVSGFEGDSVYGYKACKTRRAIFPQIIYFYVAFNTWLPTALIVSLNAVLIIEIRRNGKRRQHMTSSVLTKSDEKATKLLLIVSSAYVLLILPLGIVQTVELIYNSNEKVAPGHKDYTKFMTTKIQLKWARAFFFFFYQFNFAINFFFYVAVSSSTRFRATLKKLMGFRVQSEEVSWTRTRMNKPSTVAAMPSVSQEIPEERIHMHKPEILLQALQMLPVK